MKQHRRSTTAVNRKRGCHLRLDILARYDKDAGRWVAGSESLDVWSSGEDPKEALDAAEQAIFLFLNEATRMKTVWDVLKAAKVDVHPGPVRFSEPRSKRLRNLKKTEFFFPLTFQIGDGARQQD